MINKPLPAQAEGCPARRSLLRRNSPLLILGGMAALSFGAPIVLPLGTPLAQAQRPIGVYINEQPLSFGSAAPARIGGRVFVPMRAIFEALGAQVSWDAATQSINAQRAATVVQMQIGNRNANLNGQATTLDQPPLLYGGATMVPLRFVGEALGAEVRWSETQSAVFITNNPGTSTPLPGTTPGTVPGTIPGTTPVIPGTTPIIPGTTPIIPGTTPPVPVPPQANEVVGTVVKVDPTPPATITVRVKDAAGATRIETYTLAPNAQLQRSTALFPTQAGVAPDWKQPTRMIINAYYPGEEVRIQLGANNVATAISSQTVMAAARVRSAQDRQIVLDDGRNTTLTIGDQVRYVNKAGRPNAPVDVRPGESIALFVAPSTYTIFAASAREAEIVLAGGTPNAPVVPGTTPIIPGTTPVIPGTIPGFIDPANPGTNPPGTAFLQSVTHNAMQPLKSGANVQISVRANSTGLRGAFTISPRMPAQPLLERADRPGVYVATYQVRPGDDVLNGRVTVTMTGPNNVADTMQSDKPITIDTVPPRITGVFPANGTQTNNATPNMAVYADDIGGSGLSRGTIRLTLINGQNTDVPAVVVVGGLSAETPRALPAGPVSLRATVADAAGNEAQAISNFTVVGNVAGGVTSVAHNARAALRTGEVLVTEMRGDPNGRATFDLVGDNNRVVATNLPMREIEPGRYQGTYTVQGNEATNRLRVVGRFAGANNQPVTNEATTMVSLAAAVTPQAAFSVTAPANQAAVQSPLTVRGRALPGAIVDVAVRADGTKVTRLLILENRRPYTQELGTQQVQADANGNWATRAIELPAIKDVEDLKFVITATQTDSLNRRSDPITLTVTPK